MNFTFSKAHLTQLIGAFLFSTEQSFRMVFEDFQYEMNNFTEEKSNVYKAFKSKIMQMPNEDNFEIFGLSFNEEI